jgi:tetratricopeptide (TPR) repeat protein
MLGGWLPDRLQTLMSGFRAIDDWPDAAVLQGRVNKAHRADVLSAPPHATPGDYQQVRHAAERIDSQYDHDAALQRLVSQELADGFVDDAEQSVSSISGARIRSETYTNVAIFRWKQGQVDAAGRSFEAAVNAALQTKDTFMVNPLEGEASDLDNIAKRRYEAGDVAGAVGMFAHLHTMAEGADEPFRTYLCGYLARTQLDLGLFDGARSAAKCIKDANDRKSVENEIADKETEQSVPSKAITDAMGISNPEDQMARLAELGAKQAEAGNTNDAMRALDQAVGVAQHLSAPDHYVAYPLRRIAFMYLEMGERAKGETVLRRLRALKESIASPREQYDFLYDLAVGYADFGFFEEAHSYIREMDPYPNEQACNVVAYEQAQQGEMEEAVIWAEKLADPAARTSALVGVVEAMLEANEASTTKTNR